ncbi:MAG: L-aspartate oxidase [Zetaproteobacteria bacterium]|nr:MAG: L-aspartate oxidase [Zetaproteobacteria bacterium]
MTRHETDVAVVGCGLAGMWAALQLADAGFSVTLINKGEFSDSSTYRAQGGIAGVADVRDRVADHVADTLRAGAGLCKREVVEAMVARSGAAITQLERLGIRFDRRDGDLHLTREGGHGRPRIAHVQDATGRAVSEGLQRKVTAHPAIRYLAHHMAIDLVVRRGGRRRPAIAGLYLLDPEERVIALPAPRVVLATGGAGKVYMYTTNPHAATGDGIAMAWRAGCPVANMEMMQFHPTCLFHPQAPTMLLSEALRGEGAILIDAAGRRFMERYDPERMELAPRDIVARAIDHEMKRQGVDCLYLDARPLGEATIDRHFPNIRDRLLALGIDIKRQPVPVVPAAHYLCGGVQTDLAGRTPVDGLFVIGEAACSGVHGANRLASNSLLECHVMASLCAETIIREGKRPPLPLPPWDASGIEDERERVQIKQNWDEVRAVMSNYVGLVRSNERLRRARRRLQMVEAECADYYWRHPVSRDLIELRNLVLVATLMVRSALERKESRGLHYTIDYPHRLPHARDTVLVPDG